MSDIPNISEEYNYFEKLFDNAEKDQIGDLYKKELYIMKEDLDQNKYKTTLKLMHDTLLQKFMCEEYTEFIPKNEVAQLIYPSEKKSLNNNNNNNNSKNPKKEDGVDKELLEEYEYLKELYRINYLTFSPFALEYFEKINDPNKSSPSNKNNNDNANKDNNINDKKEFAEEQKEKDEKLLKLLNFDYNSYELNNDLLFNISQGFIDISKLKESNLKHSEKANFNNSRDSLDSSKNDEDELFEYDEELDHELIEKTMKFVTAFEKNLILKRAIVKFKDELSRLPPKCKNKIKNEFYKSWDAEFAKLAKDNERLMRRKEEEERKKQLLKQKLYLDRLKREKELEEEKRLIKENELLNQLRQIQKKAQIKSGKKNNNSISNSNSNRNIISKSKSIENSPKKKKKNVNRSAPHIKKELTKSNKKYNGTGFNLYKDMLNNKRNGSAK
jgi:hypothetical protein